MSLTLIRRTKKDLVWCFHWFLQVLERSFLQKISRFDIKKGRLKPGKLLNLFGHIGNKKDSFQYHYFDIHRAECFQTQDLLIDYRIPVPFNNRHAQPCFKIYLTKIALSVLKFGWISRDSLLRNFQSRPKITSKQENLSRENLS